MRYHTYEVLKKEVNNPRLRWAYLPYSMHMAGPREAIQHMIIRKNYGAHACLCCKHTCKYSTVVQLGTSPQSLHISHLLLKSFEYVPEKTSLDCMYVGYCRVHTLHYRAGHGRLQKHAHGRGLLCSL